MLVFTDIKKDFLRKYTILEDSNLEKLEMLEQLRILESGFKIKVLKTKFESISKALRMIIKKH